MHTSRVWGKGEGGRIRETKTIQHNTFSLARHSNGSIEFEAERTPIKSNRPQPISHQTYIGLRLNRIQSEFALQTPCFIRSEHGLNCFKPLLRSSKTAIFQRSIPADTMGFIRIYLRIGCGLPFYLPFNFRFYRENDAIV